MQRLILAAESLDMPVAVVALNTAAQGMQRQMIHNLRENEFACVHRLIAPIRNAGLKRDPGRVAGSSQ
jgi:bacteriorhodopsin